MTEKLERLYQEASCGNEEAFKFLLAWNKYCHGIDDVIDDQIKDPQQIISIFVLGTSLYNSNFWIKFQRDLYLTVILIANDFCDSNLEIEPFKDILRFSGNYMVKSVAFICGGYDCMRNISNKLNIASYTDHHTEKGEPI